MPMTINFAILFFIVLKLAMRFFILLIFYSVHHGTSAGDELVDTP